MIKFVKYEPVLGEKFLGIASVVLFDKIMLRYKVFPGKDGKGIFFSSPSIKNGEIYLFAFEFDSNFLKNDVETCLRENIKKQSVQQEMKADFIAMNQVPVETQRSLHDENPFG